MRRMKSERGSGLVMVIGIIAALAILASSLVILVVNAQSNTQTDRNRAKSFNVAEAALDKVMYDLSGANAWPRTTAPTNFNTAGATAFRGSFATADFPDPKTGKGPFVSVVYFDNQDANGDGQITRADAVHAGVHYDYDKNKDGLLYVEAQSGVSNSATRIQAELQLVNLKTLMRENVALNTPGRLIVNNSKPDVATTGTAANAECGGGIWTTSGVLTPPYSDALDAGITGQTGASTPTADTIIAPDVIALLKDSATHSYNTALSSSTANTAIEGITYVKTSASSNLPSGATNGAGTAALPKMPGILILEGGGGLVLNGNGDFYGMIFTDGPFTNNGNYVIHGMVVAKGDVTLKGDQTLLYDPAVLYQLQNIATLHVRVVGGTWREIQPVYN